VDRGLRSKSPWAGRFLLEDGVIPLSEEIATMAAEVFRRLGSPRRRAADIAIGVTAAAFDAELLTCNVDDFADIPGLNLKRP
jgi:predicted nucleic acid-binding protein